MRENTGSKINLETGDTQLVVHIKDWMTALNRVLNDYYICGFKRTNASSSIVLGIVSAFIDPRAPSIKEIALAHSNTGRDYQLLLRYMADKDDELRELVRSYIPERATLDRVFLCLDNVYLTIEYNLPRPVDESGFETYIERLRRDGEPIHPEVDKQIRHYNSTTSPRRTSLILPSRR